MAEGGGSGGGGAGQRERRSREAGAGETDRNRDGRARRPLRPWRSRRRRPLGAGRGHHSAGARGPMFPSRPSVIGNGSRGKVTEGKKITVRK